MWTRLVPEPMIPGGGMDPVLVPVGWEISTDDAFRTIVAFGVTYATPDQAHSVHVEVRDLQPDRPYWYRFHVDGVSSPIGRARTAPAPGVEMAKLCFAVASCQHFEHGWYVAYEHMVADDPDLIIHVGDYIYERSWGENRVRRHAGGEPYTLDDYRMRYAQYRSDPLLQAAHASCPWLVVWDDHEVENDYANDRSENDDDRQWFLARRSAAYKAYYEHMPLPAAMMPVGPSMRIHTRVALGSLADIYMLDDRQYRTYQPCPKPGRGGSNLIENCAERGNLSASLLGERQEAWLAAGLNAGNVRWNLLAQQTLVAQADSLVGRGQRFYSDAWDGYPAARRRLLEQLSRPTVRNPVVFGGDVHSFWAADLRLDFDDRSAPTVASEFVTTSIASDPPPEERIRAAASEGEHIRFATGARRGYLRVDLSPSRLVADMRGVEDVKDPHSSCDTMASFVVESGRAGPQRA
jgi:alkaline phosphatase D